MGGSFSCGHRFRSAISLSGGAILLAASAFAADTVFLKDRPEGNRGVVIEESDEHVLIRFPRSEIRLIRRNALPNSERPVLSSVEGEVRSPEGHLAPAQGGMVDQQGKALAAPQVDVDKEAGRSGAVQGRIVYRGKGLAGCKVKLIRQLESTTLLGLLQEAKAGAEFDAITGEDGLYRFEQVPPGKYLLRWLPPGSDAWIQKLSDRPYDVLVGEGMTVGVREVDMSRRVLDR